MQAGQLFKSGKIKCCIERNITNPLNTCRNILKQFRYLLKPTTGTPFSNLKPVLSFDELSKVFDVLLIEISMQILNCSKKFCKSGSELT